MDADKNVFNGNNKYQQSSVIQELSLKEIFSLYKLPFKGTDSSASLSTFIYAYCLFVLDLICNCFTRLENGK